MNKDPRDFMTKSGHPASIPLKHVGGIGRDADATPIADCTKDMATCLSPISKLGSTTNEDAKRFP